MKTSILATIALSFSIAVAHAESAVPALKLAGSIPMPGVAGRIDHFSIDLQHQVVYVATLGANSLQMVSLREKKVIGSITGLEEPQGVVYVPENGRLYVANGGDGSLRIYDGASLKPIKTVAFGDDADNLRFDSATKTLWLGYGSGAVAQVDLDGSKLGEVQLGEHPEAFSLERNGTRMYVNVPRKREVAVVDRKTMTVLATYGTGSASENYPMAYDEDGQRLFLGCRTPAALVVLDAKNGKSVSQLLTVATTDDLFFDSAPQRVYVLGGGGAVAIYGKSEVGSYSQIGRVETAPGGRTGLLVPELHELLVAIPQNGSAPAKILIYQTIR